jgi:hypothetical protein
MVPLPKEKKVKKKRMSCPSKDTATASKKPRARNFSSTEDVILCRPYENSKTNPITENWSKSFTVLALVKGMFNAIYDSEGREEEEGKGQRSAHALLNRFRRMIQKEMNIFNRHYRYILMSLSSGAVESEYIVKAAERFLEDESRPFLCKHCVEVLHQLPKFIP